MFQALKVFIKLHILAPIPGAFLFFSKLFLPPTLGELKYDTEYFLAVPTPDGTSQAVHPDVVSGIPGAPAFVLACTPYPFTMDRFENPCVLVSDDGLRFTEEKKGLNPLVPPPPIDHNDDPDIHFADGRWKLLYLETMRPAAQNLVMLESPDRVTWTKRVAYPVDLTARRDFIVSPSFIEGEGKEYLFVVNTSTEPYRVEYADVTNGIDASSMSARVPVPLSLGELQPWHVDVIRGDDAYYMLVSAVRKERDGKKSYSLHIARSRDLAEWELSAEPVLDSAYRSSGLVRDGDLFVYFSRQTGILGSWMIGVYRTELGRFFGGEPCASR
jgi:hypothetical protein